MHNHSLCKVARMLGVNHALLIRWTAKLPVLKATRGKLRKSADKGHVDQLDTLKFELLVWVFAHCKQEIVVTKAQVVFKASSIALELRPLRLVFRQ